jgi:tetratricopeptide (TPR) repeat protein/Zn-dependent protease
MLVPPWLVILLFLGFFLYPYVLAVWTVRNRVFECSRVEPANPEDLTVAIQEAVAPAITSLEAANFELISYQYIYAGIVGDPPAWGLLFCHSTAQIYAVLLAPQPFHQYPVILCDVITVLEDNHKIITTNSKNYQVHPQGFQETRIHLMNAPVEQLITTHLEKLDRTVQTALTMTEAELMDNILQHNLEKIQHGVKLGIFRWAKPHQQYQYTLRSALKMTFQVWLELILPSKAIQRVTPTSTVAQVNQAQSEAEAFLADLTPRPGLSKQKRGWLAIGSLALFVAIYAMKFGASTLVIFLAALLLHEGGHLLAMICFGYRSPIVFFIPFFGALATARKEHASLSEKFWISMAGPLPGLILGIAIVFFQTHELDAIDIIDRWYGENNLWREASQILIGLNLFNLLPIYPLDGGQISDLLVFSRNPYLGVIYKSIGVGLLLLLGLINPMMFGFGLIIALSIPHSYRIARWFSKLRQELQTIPWQDDAASAELIFTRLQSAPKISPVQRQLIAAGIFESRRADAAPWRSRLGLSLIYLVSLLTGLLGGVYSLMPEPKMLLSFATSFQTMFQSPEAHARKHLKELDAKILKDPQNFQLYRYRARVKARLKDFPGALADADRMLKIEPKSMIAYRLRSDIYRDMGEEERSQADDRKAREIQWMPQFQTSHAQIKKNTKNLSAYVQRAEAKFGLNDQQGAFQDLDFVLKKDAKHTEALFLRSSFYDQQQNYSAAIKDLDRIIELKPDDYEAYDLRAELYVQLGDDVKADADAQKAFELFERSPEAKANPQRVEAMRRLQSLSPDNDAESD